MNLTFNHRVVVLVDVTAAGAFRTDATIYNTEDDAWIAAVAAQQAFVFVGLVLPAIVMPTSAALLDDPATPPGMKVAVLSTVDRICAQFMAAPERKL